MVNKSSVDRLKEIAKANDADVAFEEAADGTYIDCKITKGDTKLYCIITRFDDGYYTYGLNSDVAPP